MQVSEATQLRESGPRRLVTWIWGRFDRQLRDVVTVAPLSFAFRTLGAVVNFAGGVAVARLLGADGAGTYYLAVTVVTIASVFSRVGLDLSAMQFVAAHAAVNDWDSLVRDHATGRRVVRAAGVVATGLALVTAGFLGEIAFGQPEMTGALRIMVLGIVPLAIGVYQAGALKGVGRPLAAVFSESVGVPLLALVLLPPLAVRYGLNGAAASFAIAAFVTAAIASWMWGKTPARTGTGEKGDARAMLATAWPFLWIAAMNQVMLMADLVMLGIFRPEQEVGVYGAAMRAGGLLTFILFAVNSIAAPKFASLWRVGDRDGLRRLAQGVARIATICAVLPATVLVIWPGLILAAFGPDFRGGATALRLVTIGQFCSVAAGSVGHLLAMTGYQRVMRNCMIASAFMFVVLNGALIPRHGPVGAAGAFGLSLMFLSLLMAVRVRQLLGFWTLPFLRRRVAGEVVSA